MNVFFVLSTGRTGTKFLAQLLNRDPNAKVFHERFKQDFDEYVHAYHDEKSAIAYIKESRMKLIPNEQSKIYGEITGVLRHHIKALKTVFPEARLFHLVRDGREVIRSMASREIMLKSNAISSQIYPKESDPFYMAWPNMDQFERICWYWSTENRFLRENIKDSIQFEGIISDYSYLRKRLLDEVGLNIPHDIWNDVVKTKINATKIYKIPHWRQWNPKQQGVFEKIAASENRLSGYN